MTRIVTSTYRYKRPPRKKKPVLLEVPPIVKRKAEARLLGRQAKAGNDSRPVEQPPEPQDEVGLACGLLDLPRTEPLDETQRTIGETGIERRLQHARQGHQQAGNHIERQHNSSLPAVGAGEVHPHVCAADQHSPDCASVVRRNIHLKPAYAIPILT
jgi:hypothetical protein